MIKLFGGVLIVASCGCFGFLMAGNCYQEQRGLRQWVSALDFMQCQLQYHMTPLPELCRETAQQCTGKVKELFLRLALELDNQIEPDVRGCMKNVLSNMEELPFQVRSAAQALGNSLGRFDSDGQILQLEAARRSGRERLERIGQDAQQRIRGYQTLGVCAGAALAILLV